MAGEIEQIPRLPRLKGDGPRGKAVHQPGVPVEGHPAEEPGHEGQPRAVHAQGGLTAPAVLGALVGQGHLHRPGPQGLLGHGGWRFVIILPETTLCIALPAVREGYFLPALPGLPDGGGQRPPGQGVQHGALHLRPGQHVGKRGADEPLVSPGPVPGGAQMLPAGPALVAVFGADAAPAGGEFLQKLGGPAAQQLVGALRAGAGGGIEGAQGGRDYNFHEKTSQSLQFCATLEKSGLLD